MKTFIEDLKNELKKTSISDEKIVEIIEDHEEMIMQAKLDGLSEEDLLHKFGDPKKLAQELSQFEETTSTKTSSVENPTYQFKPTSEKLSISTKLVEEDTDYFIVDDDHITVNFSGKVKLDLYRVDYQNGLLTIELKKKLGFHFNYISNHVHVTVEIPKKLIIEEIKHSSVNADLDFSNLIAKVLNIHTVNGDLSLHGLDIENLHINTVDGDVNLSKTSLKEIHASSVSGDFQFDEVNILGELSVNSVSGDVNIHKSKAESFNLCTVSGDANGKEFYVKKVSLSSISGDIHIENERKESVEILKKKSISGDIHLSL